MTVEPMVRTDISNLQQLQPEGWVGIIEPFEFYLASANCSPFKVCLNGDLVGVGAGNPVRTEVFFFIADLPGRQFIWRMKM